MNPSGKGGFRQRSGVSEPAQSLRFKVLFSSNNQFLSLAPGVLGRLGRRPPQAATAGYRFVMGCRLRSGRTNPALPSMPFRHPLVPLLGTQN